MRNIIRIIGGFCEIIDGLATILTLGYKTTNLSGAWTAKHFFSYVKKGKK